jgi:hypothetical protein
MPEQEREHVTEGLDCWCGPYIEAYGDDALDDEGGDDDG